MKELLYPQGLVIALQALGILVVAVRGGDMTDILVVAVTISATIALIVWRFDAYHYEESTFAVCAHAMGTAAAWMTFLVIDRGFVGPELSASARYALPAVMWAAAILFGVTASQKAVERGVAERPLMLALIAQPFVGPVIGLSAYGLRRADPRTRENLRTIAFTVVALCFMSGGLLAITLLGR